MSFSERMKESLGSEGARVEVVPPESSVSPGGPATTLVRIHGGSRDAHIDAIVVRVIEARRSWTSAEGQSITDDAARSMDRRQLNPTWERRVVHQMNVSVDETVGANSQHEVPIEVPVPDTCGTTDPACVITVNAQADIKEQIDPTGTATLLVAQAG